MSRIANVLRASGCPVPEYMLSLAPPSKNTKRNLAKAPPKRKTVGGGGRDVGKEEGRRKRAMIDASRKRAGGGGGDRQAADAEGEGDE
jgi:ATP-dependent RNA helicase DDX52/ROK1